jgi:hypothetical protein
MPEAAVGPMLASTPWHWLTLPGLLGLLAAAVMWLRWRSQRFHRQWQFES